MTPRGSVRHPLWARLYVRQSDAAADRGLSEQRRRLLAGLQGRVIEIGAGHGANFAFYVPEVTSVVAVEPEPYLRERAREAARHAEVEIQVVAGVAEELPFDDAVFDAGVASLVLCSVGDPARSARELHRVIRPGGELRFNEHVVSRRRLPAALQRAADATIWPHVAGGCHLARDSERVLVEAGFVISQVERFRFSASPLDPPKSHLLGTARRPAPGAV